MTTAGHGESIKATEQEAIIYPDSIHLYRLFELLPKQQTKERMNCCFIKGRTHATVTVFWGASIVNYDDPPPVTSPVPPHIKIFIIVMQHQSLHVRPCDLTCQRRVAGSVAQAGFTTLHVLANVQLLPKRLLGSL